MTENIDPAAAPVSGGKKAGLVRRLGSTLLLWALFAGALVSGKPAFLLALFAAIGILATIEFFLMLKNIAGRFQYSALLIGIGYLAGVCWISVTEGVPHSEAFDIGMIALAGIAGISPWFWSKPDGTKTLIQVMGSVFGFLYIPFLISFLPRVFVLPNILPEGSGSGLFYLLYLIMVTKFTDMGAYITGSLIGKHKMAPDISPGKTWQGFCGALVFSVGASVILTLLLPEQLSLISPSTAVVLGLVLGFLAVIGDLAESVLKRCLDTKDSGGVLPGIGGMLDLVDSLLFTGPALYFYLRYIAAG